MNRPAWSAWSILLGLLLCTSCVSLPQEGEVQVSEDRAGEAASAGFPYDPRPPQPGEEPVEIVRHFLDAMLATPTSNAVAKQFLTTEAAADWRPEMRMITYEDFGFPSGDDQVELNLRNANHLDAGGRWSGALDPEESRISFTMAREDGEWRIAGLPNATIVSEEFFTARYQQVSLYYFDPTGSILIPEPAYVPRGGPVASALVRALLRGPGPDLSGVAESFIPSGLALDLSVPVSADGVASVSLRGDATNLDRATAQRMAEQMAWTLRQDPTVRRIKMLVNDNPVALEDAPTEFGVDTGEARDPAGANAWPDMFALRDGRLMSVAGDMEGLTDGPFGRRDLGLRSVAVDLAGRRAVGVTSSGTKLLEAPVGDSEDAVARTVLSGATDLLRPAWDHADRVWLVDRTARGARIAVIANGQTRTVQVPGISGEDVTSFIVSRDASRLAAVVSTAAGDVVRLSRLAGTGVDVRASTALALFGEGTAEPRQIKDLAWQSPTRILVTQAFADGISLLDSFSVDGSPADAERGSVEGVVRHDLVEVIAAPIDNSAVWGVGADGAVHRLNSEDTGVPAAGLVSLGYVG